LFTGHQSDGFIYVEDQGDTLPTGYTDGDAVASIAPSLLTRRIYGAGVARDSREEAIYVLHDSIGDTFSVSSCTVDSTDLTKLTKTGGFTNVIVGMLVTGTNVPPGTIVASKPDNNTIHLSTPMPSAGSVDLTFDDGTIAVTIRGQGIGENGPTTFDTSYLSTRIGDVLVARNDNTDQALELQIAKPANLGNIMKLHTFTMLIQQMGLEQNRA
jgi:hypothetical protein